MSTPRKQLTPATSSLATRVTEFWRNVRSTQSGDDCWPWTGYEEDGYGRFFFQGKMRGAHELALTFTTGERRAPGLDTCHSCNNPICCNPRHLRFGTRQSNVDDMVAAGTNLGRHGKLSFAKAQMIRLRIANGARQQDLADEFGVTNGMISQIKNGKRYANGR